MDDRLKGKRPTRKGEFTEEQWQKLLARRRAQYQRNRDKELLARKLRYVYGTSRRDLIDG